MKKPLLCAVLSAILMSTLSSTAYAQRGWLLPSTTVLSGPEWVTVDAAVSNQLFHLKLGPLALEQVNITGPDGTALAPQHIARGNLRNSFEFRPEQPGTYKITVTNEALVTTYTASASGGSGRAGRAPRNRRWIGAPADYAQNVPDDARIVGNARVESRYETFITVGRPDEAVLQPAGVGLELLPLTHPNDLYAGETAQFQFLVDGAPAPDLRVSVIAGNARYRDELGEIVLRTDQAGKFSVTWPRAGMYWLHAAEDNGELSLSGSGSPTPIAPPHEFAPGTADTPTRRAHYSATLEVLQP